MKKFGISVLLLACLLMILSPFQALAASSPLKIVIDDQEVALDVKPLVKDNRVLVPVRGVLEELGMDVTWDQASQTAVIQSDDNTIEMKLGAKEVLVNGKTVAVDSSLTLEGDKLYFPIRFILEITGSNVKWNQATQTIAITSKESLDKTKAFLTKLAEVKYNSVSAEMNIVQAMEFMGEKITTDMDLKMDMVLDPFGIYQHMTMTMEQLGDEKITMESYMTKDGYYSYESTMDQWIKYEDDLLGDLESLSANQIDPATQIELMQRFYENVKVVETDNTYELHASISGSGFQELLDEILDLSSLGLDADLLTGFEMTIDKMDMVSVYDKETLLPLSGTLDSDLTMVIEGEKMKMTQQAEFSYFDYDKLTEIKIPKEAIDKAISFEEYIANLESGL